MSGTTVRAMPRATAASALPGLRLRLHVLDRAGARLRGERFRHDAPQPVADRPLGQARIDARLAGLRTAGAETGRSREPEQAVRELREQRPAGVALTGVGAALRIAGAHHRLRVERAVVGDLAE